MAPIRQEDYGYIFDHGQLKAIRDRLGMSQATLAGILDVPVNTLSRWENGVTSPDAKALAAIYSISKGKGVTPDFFRKQAQPSSQKRRTKLLIAWDFQNEGLKAGDLEEEWNSMLEYLDLLFPGTKGNRTLRAYTTLLQREAGDVMKRLKFDIREGIFDADSQLIKDTAEDCNVNPEKWVFILAAEDGDYVNMLKYLAENGVDTYVWASEDCNEKLKSTLVNGHFIDWYAPYVVVTCMEVIGELKGKPVTRGQFGNLCREALSEDDIYPNDVGFSRRNPYGSLLRWLDRQGIISVTEVTGKKDTIRIAIQSDKH